MPNKIRSKEKKNSVSARSSLDVCASNSLAITAPVRDRRKTIRTSDPMKWKCPRARELPWTAARNGWM